jgi:lipopolysaccharide export system permease protein
MPWTLYRYILKDVVKVLALVTAVLVLLISFAMAIKPLADGLLGATLLIKFVLYTMPTVLGFAVPFAGAFASTIVFIRLASDNEITAAAASGISYAKVLAPVVALGLVLTLGLFALANFVVPPFYRYAAHTVQQDVVTALVNQLDQNRPFTFEKHGLVVYADKAESHPPPELPGAAIQPSKHIELRGFAGMKLGQDGAVEGEATAESATILVFNADRQSWVKMRLRNFLGYNARAGQVDRVSGQQRDFSLRLRRPFKDDPKYLSYGELNELRRQPQRYDQVQQLMQNLAQALARTRLQQKLRAQLTGEQARPAKVTLQGASGDERYILHAPKVTQTDDGLGLEAQNDRPVLVDLHEAGQPARRYEAQSAELTLPSGDDTNQAATGLFGLDQPQQTHTPRLQLSLHRVRIYDSTTTTRPSQKQTHTLAAMHWPGPILQQFDLTQPRQLRLDTLRGLASEPPYSAAGSVQAGLQSLNREMYRLHQEIVAQLHQRAASAVACVLLLALGAVLSMQLKGQMPLVVYLWSFLLALFTLIIINSGRHMAGSGEYAIWQALSVMWAGNIVLMIVTGVMYCRLARH